jgi:hypothetical protein
VLTIRVQNFSGNTGCTATLQGSLGLRPNNPF